MLPQNFKKYFIADDKLAASYERVKDPFLTTSEDLSTAEKEIFIGFTASSEIERETSKYSIFEFWARVNDAFFPLKTRAIRILLPFSTSRLCEDGFSVMAALKTKYRYRLNIDEEFRVAICNIKPSFEKFCYARQAQGSH
ncbi:unnamed protein product [Psylliodes chrysocephalus]|uniref:Uncharacterized protein n=1 Tax=Psylliodes chrysocephalus TaxID=3402493 RepID=A0A9P0D366_9CUCU|nr:unnamed protein product [Psylliodes chrysocephala]